MPARFLTALPVYNEVRHVTDVLDEVRKYSQEILVVDDGSTDGTSQLLAQRPDIHVVRHPTNRGYGAGLSSAFEFALANRYDILVTIDCDGQHEPKRIPQFVEACDGWDLVSGSRYLQQYPEDSQPPADRRRINEMLTGEINRRLGLSLTDAFCGFKAYRVAALEKIELHETGYAMPLEFWVQAVHAGLRIRELPVPLIYLEEERSFGGSLDNADTRLRYYREVLDRASARIGQTWAEREGSLCGKSPAGGWSDQATGSA
ncbi:MAG TPA: glycosyltransferase family 2 protein [Pirellulales bacterium]|jgi:dolichol-phosphate mannosyltransferase|nr:glycosyltransferase family 2 protein [Pirellulales bacterium]